MDGLWATKSKGVGLIVLLIAISVEDFQPTVCDSDPPTLQTDGWTDRQTDNMQSQDRALHYSASRVKNADAKQSSRRASHFFAFLATHALFSAVWFDARPTPTVVTADNMATATS